MTTNHLLGRETELTAFTDAMARVHHVGASFAVTGEPGIGKSALLETVKASATSRGFTVLGTTGIETENHLPYAGLHEILRPLSPRFSDLPVPQRRALLTALGLHEGPRPEPFLVSLAALSLLTSSATQKPVLMIADDVQWLDEPSQDVLAFIARRIASDRIVCIGAARSGDTGPFVQAAQISVELCGLDDDTARTLLGRHAQDLARAERERILQQALGNPLALRELPAAWRSTSSAAADITAPIPLSDRLERAFAAKLDEMAPPARDVLLVAAVDAGGDASELLAAATVLAGQEVGLSTVDEAVQAGLTTFEDYRIRFRHPLVRSAVLQVESLRRRQTAHAAMAQVLRHEPYRRAWHRSQSIIGPDDEVAAELEHHHTISISRGAVPEAIAALERAAQLSTDSSARGRRLLLAAEHAFGLGRADLVDRLLGLAERNTLTQLDRARVEWLREIFNDGVPGDATRVFELAGVAQQAAREGDINLALNLLLGAALRCWWADTGPAARELVVAVVQAQPAGIHDPRHVATLAVAEPVAYSAKVTQMLDAVAIETISDADALRLYGMAAHAIGDPARAVDCFDRAEAQLRDQGRLGLLSHVLTMGMYDRMELGDWQRARHAAEETQRIAHETGQPIWDTGTLSIHAMLLGLHGDPRAHELAERAEHAANGRRLNNLLACVKMARGYAYASTGRYEEAYLALRRIFDPDDASYHLTEWFHAVMYFAEAAAHTGRRQEARGVLNRLEGVVCASASPTLALQLLYARAVLAEDDVAETHYVEALAHDLTRWPLLKARLELAYGTWLRRQRRVAESRPPLRSAKAALDHIGATWWAQQAINELRASGERTAQTGLPAASEVLSPQELQIARLAADGMSNRQIGERLFLSPRTVGSHLYRMFPKLGITSRFQIAERLDLVP